MRKIFFVLMVSVFVVACEKPNNELIECGEFDYNISGESIPGFGNSNEPATGTPFALPEGVVYDGLISGYDPSGGKSAFNNGNYGTKQSPSSEILTMLSAESSAKTVADAIMGSGYYVEILIPLRNVTALDIPVTFPAGLLFHSQSGTYQNGLLIKAVTITVPANGTFNLVLQLYCCNMSLHASDGNAVYINPVVSNSSKIVELCGLVSHKKVNTEDYPSNNQSPYRDLIGTMQQLVWKLSWGGSLETENYNFINSIEND